MRTKSIEWQPDKLHFRFGGHPEGTWVELEWRGPFLHYRSGTADVIRTEETHLQPCAATWERFWSDLSQTGVWSWAGDYSSPDDADGASWSLEIHYQDHRISCRGRNGYPETKGSDFPLGSAFDMLLQSLQALTGDLVPA
jgi:hypothetical protein